MVDGVAAVVGDRVLHRVIRPVAGVLNVVDLKAQPAEPLKVVQHLPGHARERGSAHNP